MGFGPALSGQRRSDHRGGRECQGENLCDFHEIPCSDFCNCLKLSELAVMLHTSHRHYIDGLPCIGFCLPARREEMSPD